MSLMDYRDRIVWVNLAIYILYFIIKYLPAVVYFFIWLVKCCRKSNDSPSNKPTPPLPWVLLLVFGKQLGLKDASKLHKIFLHDTKVMSRSGQIMVFYVVIFGSIVLALGSAFDITFFSPSHICTEDPSIDCYPQLISGANGTNLTMPVDISEPIPDCSYWNGEGVSRQITFICFQREFFNFELFLAVTGGLLAFAFIALNASIGLLLRITRYCMNKTTDTTALFVIRVIVIIVAIVVELAMAIVCLVLGATSDSADTVNDDPGVTFLTMHASEILVVVGIVATLLWLPWEEYVKHQQKYGGQGGAPNALAGMELQENIGESSTAKA